MRDMDNVVENRDFPTIDFSKPYDKSNWQPVSFEEACNILRSNPITPDMSYEERLEVQKRRFGL